MFLLQAQIFDMHDASGIYYTMVSVMDPGEGPGKGASPTYLAKKKA